MKAVRALCPICASMRPRSISRGNSRHSNYSIFNHLRPLPRAPLSKPSPDRQKAHSFNHLNRFPIVTYTPRERPPHFSRQVAARVSRCADSSAMSRDFRFNCSLCNPASYDKQLKSRHI